MSLPYNEKLFNELHKDLHDRNKKMVSVVLSDLFNSEVELGARKEIIGAIERVARLKGFRTIIVRDTSHGKYSVMEFYRYDYAH